MTTLGVIAALEVESGVSSTNLGHGFVTVRVTDEEGNVMVGQVDPALCRTQGLNFLEAAEAAVHDAALFRLLVDVMGVGEEVAAGMIGQLRGFREDQQELEGE